MNENDTTSKHPRRRRLFDKRRREWRLYRQTFDRLVERRGGLDCMSAEQIVLADQAAEGVGMRKACWAAALADPNLTPQRAAELRAQWVEASSAVRHAIAALRDTDPRPGGGDSLLSAWAAALDTENAPTTRPAPGTTALTYVPSASKENDQ